jgi:hypothetical protein
MTGALKNYALTDVIYVILDLNDVQRKIYDGH